eukprot:24929-Pleurochrysis_carterae.AAC.1
MSRTMKWTITSPTRARNAALATSISTSAAPAVPRGAGSSSDGADGIVTSTPNAPVSILANVAHADAGAGADADAPVALAAAVPATPASAGRFAATFEL